MSKVLITSRSFGQTSRQPFEILENAGIEYELMGADFNQEIFDQKISEYDGLIIGAHPFSPEVMEKCEKLNIICKHGAGLDNINLPYASEKHITVTNVPAMNSNAVADLAFGHILNLSRGISKTNAWVREKQWKSHIGTDVFGKTLGLIGFGAIAQKVARRSSGFNMKLYVYDPYLKNVPDEFLNVIEMVDFDTLIEKSDIISIHVPLTESTRNLFDKQTMLRMKKDAYLINTGRGGIINEKDLYECLTSGHLLGAALDVTSNEPIEAESPLLTLDNVVITPHIGMYSKEAINAVSVVCAENIVSKFKNEEVRFKVV